MYKNKFKRFFDFIGALLFLLLFFPVYIILIVFLFFYYKGTPFFTQKRPGLNNQIFHVIKFKSMIDAFDKEGNPLPNKDRITRVGRFLRKTSLDEIPQIFNIIKGDMSFVGPRPLFESYLDFYTKRELERHSVRPGVTGLAQVNGRNFLEWNDRLALDVKYAKNVSFIMDVKILYLTFLKVLKSQDISVVPSMTPLYKVREKRK
ncbi:sugar transferase [Tenacibaculum discolor]|uniref:sugar transferase n=1 Tax=Tenacibaculum discolor TaxID=361581 RepID=UPI000EB376CD|nr:sugar transferase [Tenacibaculum discolor]RLJ97691.1 lipopolysaccharide/colanic/teichoic acid biosynthesis glycosyltransferase [Tenacibaculum discolor]